MRVTVLLGLFPVLSETFILDQIVGLVDRGLDVRVHAQRPPGDPVVHKLFEEYRLWERTRYRPAGPPNRYLRALQTLGLVLAHGWRSPRAVCRALNPARYGRDAASGRILRALIPLMAERTEGIVHAHFGPQGVLAAALQEIGAFRGPLLVTFHGYDVHITPRRRGAGYYDRIFARAARITVGTDFMRERLLALGAPANRITKLPMGVSLRRFPFTERRPHPDEPVIILSVGRLVEGKGIEDGLIAFRQVVQEHSRARYWVVGSGPLLSRLERIAADLGIDRSVRFLGGQTMEQVAALYRGADLLLHPGKVAADGWVESQGVVLAEAAASGLPVVATRVGGIPESVIDGTTGFLVESGDHDTMARRLRQLVENQDLRAEMGRQGRHFVEERYDLSALSDRLTALYTEVAG